MNILLINHYAGSTSHGMEYRPYYLAREWVRMGHQVTIVASSVSHVRTSSPHMKGWISEEMMDGIRYCWLKTPQYHGNGFKRGFNILAFVFQLYYFTARWVDLNPDVVIASSTHPLDNLPGKWIAKRAGAKLIYEVHDLWPLSLIELGNMSPRHPFVQLIQWAENFAYRNADIVVSLLPLAFEHMHAHGLPLGRFVYIPNGIDVDEWEHLKTPLPSEQQNIIETARRKFKFLVGYAGAHGVANALDTVLDAAELLKTESIGFILVGQGPEKKWLEERCRRENIDNVFFLSTIEKYAVPSFLSLMDALYIGLKNEPLFRFGVSPNKLLDYMMSAKPIIYAINSGNDPVLEAGCGVKIPSQDCRSLAQAIQALSRRSKSELQTMGLLGRDYCLKHHDYRQLARNFLTGMNNAA